MSRFKSRSTLRTGRVDYDDLMRAAQPVDRPRQGGHLIGGHAGPALSLRPSSSAEFAIETAVRAVDRPRTVGFSRRKAQSRKPSREPIVLSVFHVSRSTAAALSLRASGTGTALGRERNVLRQKASLSRLPSEAVALRTPLDHLQNVHSASEAGATARFASPREPTAACARRPDTPGDQADARRAKMEGIVWARLPTDRAGPYAWSTWATPCRYLDDDSLAIDNNAAQPRGRRSPRTGNLGRPRTPAISLPVPSLLGAGSSCSWRPK
jgi:hypothetical protein